MPAAKLTIHQQTAVVAAVASGKSQAQVAKEFNVSQGTVSRLVMISKNCVPGPENVLAMPWRERHKLKAIKAVDRLDEIEDASKAVEKGVQVLKGLGEYDSDGGQTKVEVWLGSDAVAKIAAKWTTTASGALPDNGATDGKLLNP